MGVRVWVGGCAHARSCVVIVVFVGLSQQKRCVKYSVKLIDVKINMLLFNVWILVGKTWNLFLLCVYSTLFG